MIDWNDIVGRYSGVVWKTAFRVLGNRADASDCMQETFLAALEFSRRNEIRSWPALLQHLATARAIDLLRHRTCESKRRDVSVDVSKSNSNVPDPSLREEETELIERLRQALTQLPENQAEVYCLRCLNDLSYEEIGEQLGIGTGSVGSLLHRARAGLRAVLDPCVKN